MNALDRALEYCSQICYCNRPTLLNTIETAKYAIEKGIPGDFVELGVAAGAQIILVAAVCEQMGSNKKIYAFDSFQGISMASHHDTVQAGIGAVKFDRRVNVEDTLKSSGVSVHPLEAVKNNIKTAGVDLSRFVFIEGWVEETLKVHAPDIDKICWYRTDVDQYYPTKYGLDYLFSKISKGAPVIIDDWELTGARKAVTDKLKKAYKIKLPIMHDIKDSTPKYFYR